MTDPADTARAAPATGQVAPFDAELARAAITTLGGNWHGHSTVPSRGLYPHQWSWTPRSSPSGCATGRRAGQRPS